MQRQYHLAINNQYAESRKSVQLNYGHVFCVFSFLEIQMVLCITIGGYGMQHKVLLVLETHSPLLVWSFVFRYQK